MTPADELDPEERAHARKVFQGKAPGIVCVHCAGIHDSVHGLPRDRQPCARVKTATFHLDGTLTHVEYWPAGWDKDEDITYPRHVFIDDDDTESTEDKDTSVIEDTAA